MKKIGIFADSHLGYNRYNKISNGINVREQDIYDSFENMIDAMLEERVDAIICAGDIFNSPNPSNRARRFFMTQTKRLSDADVKIFICDGNHDKPKLASTVRVLDVINNALPGTVKICTDPNAVDSFMLDSTHKLWMLPYMNDPDIFKTEIETTLPENIESEDNNIKHILVAHATLEEDRWLPSSGEINENNIKLEQLDIFDAVFLGHHHIPKTFTTSGGTEVQYCGSLEFLTFNEVNEGFTVDPSTDKHFLMMNMDNDMSVTSFSTNARQMISLPTIDYKDTNTESLNKFLKALLTDERLDIDDKICRLGITNIPVEEYRSLDKDKLDKLKADAFSFDIIFDLEDMHIEIDDNSDITLGSIISEWMAYSAKVFEDEDERQDLNETMRDFTSKYED